jgi:predicted O-methyltransferase YrrM
MPALRQKLQSLSNDYSAEADAYRAATGNDLLSWTAAPAEIAMRVAIVMPLLDRAAADALPNAVRAWNAAADPRCVMLLLAGDMTPEEARLACADCALEVGYASGSDVWVALNGAIAAADAEVLLFATPDFLPSPHALAELVIRQQMLPAGVLLGFAQRDRRLRRAAFPENLLAASDDLRLLGHGRTIVDSRGGVSDLLKIAGAGPLSLRRETFVAAGGFDPAIDSWPHQLAWIAACAAAAGAKVVPVYAAAFDKQPHIADDADRRRALAGERSLQRRLQADFDPQPLVAVGTVTTIRAASPRAAVPPTPPGQPLRPPRERRLRHVLAQPASSHVARGKHHFAQGLLALAARDFELALLCDPDDAAARMERARLLLATGDARAAVADIEVALRASQLDARGRSDALTTLGQAWLQRGEYTRAKLAFDRAVDAHSGNATARAALPRLVDLSEARQGLGDVAVEASANAVEGWLSPEEQRLLAQMAIAAAPLGPDYLEVGSYCGKSTVVIAAALRDAGARRILHAVDPHGNFPDGRHETSLPILRENLRSRGLEPWVRIVQARSTDVRVDGAYALVFIDGDHSYESVAADVAHFRDAIAPGGFLAFHDYSRYWPGVRSVVQGVLEGGEFDFVSQRGGLIAFRRPPVG